jgi:hypothetical protein
MVLKIFNQSKYSNFYKTHYLDSELLVTYVDTILRRFLCEEVEKDY